MKRARIGMIATAVLAVATMAFAQKTDFSGTWTPDAAARRRRQATPAAAAAPMAAVAAAAGAWAGPMTVKQTGDTLTVEREGRNGQQTDLQARRHREPTCRWAR